MSMKTDYPNGNVGARIDRKRGRDVCLYRTFEDAGGRRDFTLYLSWDELERLLDSADELLDYADEEGLARETAK